MRTPERGLTTRTDHTHCPCDSTWRASWLLTHTRRTPGLPQVSADLLRARSEGEGGEAALPWQPTSWDEVRARASTPGNGATGMPPSEIAGTGDRAGKERGCAPGSSFRVRTWYWAQTGASGEQSHGGDVGQRRGDAPPPRTSRTVATKPVRRHSTRVRRNRTRGGSSRLHGPALCVAEAAARGPVPGAPGPAQLWARPPGSCPSARSWRECSRGTGGPTACSSVAVTEGRRHPR